MSGHPMLEPDDGEADGPPAPLRDLPVDLDDLDLIASTRALEAPEPYIGYLDTWTGEIHQVPLDLLDAAGNGEPLTDVLEWQEGMAEAAAAIAADTQGR